MALTIPNTFVNGTPAIATEVNANFTAVKTEVDLKIDSTIVDAKGDLIVATAADTVVRQAVGANGSVLIADSAQTNGIAWSTAQTSNRNVVINGAMAVWQRGTTAAGTTASYSPADRWLGFRSANAAGSTFSQSAVTAGTAPFNYALKVQRDSGNTGTGNIVASTSFETVNVVPLRGQILTLSFYARCGANYSPTSSLLTGAVIQGTGTDSNGASGFTSQSNYISGSATLTTSFQRFTFTGSAALATNIGQLGVSIVAAPTGTAGANDWFEVTGVQLEVGSVATPFEVEDYGTTLRKCQRYFYIFRSGTAGVSGFVDTTSKALFYLYYPTMRAIATGTMTATDFEVRRGGTAATAGSSVSLNSGETCSRIDLTVGTANLTVGQGVGLAAASGEKNITFSAEL
jgi:hypothetical protein